jgi:hypothetical protein
MEWLENVNVIEVKRDCLLFDQWLCGVPTIAIQWWSKGDQNASAKHFFNYEAIVNTCF